MGKGNPVFLPESQRKGQNSRSQVSLLRDSSGPRGESPGTTSVTLKQGNSRSQTFWARAPGSSSGCPSPRAGLFAVPV